MKYLIAVTLVLLLALGVLGTIAFVDLHNDVRSLRSQLSEFGDTTASEKDQRTFEQFAESRMRIYDECLPELLDYIEGTFRLSRFCDTQLRLGN